MFSNVVVSLISEVWNKLFQEHLNQAYINKNIAMTSLQISYSISEKKKQFLKSVGNSETQLVLLNNLSTMHLFNLTQNYTFKCYITFQLNLEFVYIIFRAQIISKVQYF